MLSESARLLILAGIILIIVGGFLLFISKFPGVGRLPGDILIRKETYTIYIPLATSFLLSLLATLIISILNRK